MTNGFRIAIKNVRFKEDASGRVRIYRVHQHIAGKPRPVLEARAKREAERWQAAEHYTPIPKGKE